MVRITSPIGMPIHASSSVLTLTTPTSTPVLSTAQYQAGRKRSPSPMLHVHTVRMKPARPSTGSTRISHSMSFQVAESPIAVWIHPSIPGRCGCR